MAEHKFDHNISLENLTKSDSSAFLNTLLDTMVDGVIVIDRTGIVQSLNDAGEVLFGYSREEVIGHNIKMLMPHKYAKGHDDNIINYIATGDAKIIGSGREVEAQRKDGSTFPMDLAVSKLEMNDGHFFAGIIRDITDRKKVEAELNETLVQLEDRVEARTRDVQKELSEKIKAQEFANERQAELAHVLRVNTLWEMGTTLAHELNQPLTVIMTYLQGLIVKTESDAIESDEMAKTLTRVLSYTQLTTDIVSRFRGFVKNESNIVSYSMVGLVNDTLDMLKSDLINNLVDVSTNFSEDLPQLNGDRVQIQQVLINLMKNSIDAIVEQSDDKLSRTIEIEIIKRNSMIFLSVLDTGIGFELFDADADADVGIGTGTGEPAFEAFYTTKASGLGMGLAISQSIIETHGGKIWVDKSIKQGAKVCISLPIKLESIGQKQTIKSEPTKELV